MHLQQAVIEGYLEEYLEAVDLEAVDERHAR
jgi:hypothetical protein